MRIHAPKPKKNNIFIFYKKSENLFVEVEERFCGMSEL